MPDTAAPRVRVVIVDDEPAARDAVRTLLADHPECVVAGEASNGHEAVDVVRRTHPDLLLLDVQMPDRDGFGVLDALGADVPRGVVFVTAHDEHAMRAFDVHALDYVLKPFGRPRFSAAISLALERLRALDALVLQRTLASMADDRRLGDAPARAPGELSLTPSTRRIGVRHGSRTIVVDIDSIDWVEAEGDYARIHAGRETHLVSQRMHELELALESAEFVRTHRSVIVNIARVRELHRDADGSGAIVLQNSVRLRVSRGRWDAVERGLGLRTG